MNELVYGFYNLRDCGHTINIHTQIVGGDVNSNIYKMFNLRGEITQGWIQETNGMAESSQEAEAPEGTSQKREKNGQDKARESARPKDQLHGSR